MANHTHIIRWNDGEADWSMVIQDGKVSIETSDATEEEAAAVLSEQWSAIMGLTVKERGHK